MQRRLGNIDHMRASYEAGLAAFSGNALEYLIRHACHTERQLCGRASWAVDLLEAAIQREPSSEALWDIRIEHELDGLEMEEYTPREGAIMHDVTLDSITGSLAQPVRYRASEVAVQRLKAIFTRASFALPYQLKQSMWKRYTQCMADCTGNVGHVRELMPVHR